MTFFPAFIKLDNRKILLVGGGFIAGEKLEKLLDFTRDVTIVAPEISEEIEAMAKAHTLCVHRRRYTPEDLEDVFVVIVAVDDIGLQKEIYEACQSRHILCNSVDSVDYCDFIFPSYTKKGALTVAFSTSGISPSVAKYLRRAIARMIPDSIADFLEEMKSLRASLPKGKERMRLLDEKAKAYIDNLFNKKDTE
ncbi:precorrin-2 dehydrogenase/sirohydrochlorin ferrochelatase family protein [Hydrogenimonas urashimensis]|uniref:precorrin-2 dehydrogenase/sirohydrochlorin ferrochelatase family protein n=1 Tax=Hydrogenimonas urashimensis TaxID=2740515 RepID=UPI001914DD7B|nr:bifunctional precorrin-2 dehydrogenase/sirohydrochlorin ferrochelatase [Hydrogenimonas urashimensis]